MRIASIFVLGATLLAFTPSASTAQDRKFHFNFGGGPTFIAGDLGDHFGTGWGPAIGISMDLPNPRLSLQFEYAYRWFGIKDDLPVLGASRFSANHQTHQLDFNLMASLAEPGSSIRPYVVAGPGAYNRAVDITEYVGNGVICDPFWYVCGTYPINNVVGSRGGWDFGFNVGGGVGFRIGESGEFYVESRYHYVMGPDIEANDNTSGGGSTNGNYFPLTFGFRF